jgi:3-methylcrotonyl-CoA carboxylase alpha subunit
VAAGEALPLLQHELALHGHAIEARIYAENPEKGFLPSTGQLLHMRMPEAVKFINGDIRIDAGVQEGDVISPHYDPMIAKLIVHGQDRAQALLRMRQALQAFEIVGPATNVAFLDRLIASSPFAQADLDTGLIERHHAALFPIAPPPPLAAIALAVAKLALSDVSGSDPWNTNSGWRLTGSYSRKLLFTADEASIDIELEYLREGWLLKQANSQIWLTQIQTDHSSVRLRADDQSHEGRVVRVGDSFHIFYAGHHYQLDWHDPIAHAGEHEADSGRLTAPMPGKIIQLLVDAGITVEQGAPLLIMEAMKMEHTISAPARGRVAEWLYAIGDQVAEGAQLLSFLPQEE